MLSIFKEKRKLNDIFNNIQSEWNYSHQITIKDFTFQINTNNNSLNFYLKNTLKEFISSQNLDYTFNFLSFKKHSGLIENSDNPVINYIQFFDTFFYYRQYKDSNLIDVLLPESFEDWEIENFFKIFISSISLYRNCLLIHASAIIIDNEVILFSGQSTAGKSTIANLSGYPIIHDDNILISHIGNEIFELETIPFKTPYIKNKFTGKIRGFYRLFQDNATYVKDINKEKQLSHLLFGLWAFNHFNGENVNIYNEQVLKYCIQILPHLKVKELYFTKTNEFLNLI